MAVAQIYIDGIICPDDWGWYCEDFTSLQSVRDQLALFTDVTEIEVFIFSPGGSVYEGWAIDGFLALQNVPITTIAYGQCASIATLPFMRGTKRKIVSGCDFMIHLPWGFIEGNEHEVLQFYNELVIEGDKLAGRYSEKTTIEKSEVKESMRVDNHMSAQQAVDLGYATELFKEVSAIQARANKQRLKVRRPIALLREPKKYEEDKVNKQEKPTVQTAIIEPIVNKVKKKNYSGTQLALRAGSNVLKGKPVFALDVNIDGGGVLEIDVKATDGNPAKGDPCKLDGATAPDGEYTASEDKTVYVVKGGVIDEIKDGNTDSGSGDDSQALAEKDTEIANLKADKTKLEARVKALESAVQLQNSALGKKSSKEVPLKAESNAVDDDKDVDGDDDDDKDKDKNKKLRASQFREEKDTWKRQQMRDLHAENRKNNKPDKEVSFDSEGRIIRD